MTISWTVAGLILLVGGIGRWNQQARSEDKIDTRQAVAMRAVELGLTVPSLAIRGNSSTRGNSRTSTPRHAAKLISLYLKMKAEPKGNREQDLKLMEELKRIVSQASAGGRQEMENLFSEIQSSPDLDEEASRDLMEGIFHALVTSANGPELAFEILTTAPDLNLETRDREDYAALALAQLAKNDFEATLRRIEEHPELLDKVDGFLLMAGMADESPVNALKFANQFDLHKKIKDLGGILGLCTDSNQQRSELMEMVRKTEDAGLLDNVLRGIGSSLGQEESSEAVVAWLETEGLPAAEVEKLVETLSKYYRQQWNTGKWLDWAAQAAPSVTLEKVPNLMEEWTKADYMAAGQWLAGFDNGPIKQAAAAAYATTSAPFDPQGSAAWVATLPTGENRREVASAVFDNWADGEPGREDFARREGLKP